MKDSICSVFLGSLLLLFISCGSGPMTSEPAGSSDYYIDNQSNLDIKVQYDGGAGEGIVLVNAKSRKLIVSDAMFGFNPNPEASFLLFQLTVTSTETVFYSEVNNDKWECEKQDQETYGFTICTFTITNTDISENRGTEQINNAMRT